MNKLFQTRRDYNADELAFNHLKLNPMDQFDLWYTNASNSEQLESNAMALATVSKEGLPSVRYLLLKAYDDSGFVFFTNFESRKGIHIKENPFGALVFYWPVLQQQVRAEGKIEMLSEIESDDYFNERPHGSKIGAWASPQSKPIPSREYLEKLKEEYLDKYKNFRIPRPKFWGGYKLIPTLLEFWQGRPDRLHDRFEYRLKDGVWKKERLAP
jgi:pyridoxamine 5'-phosphate oxidase